MFNRIYMTLLWSAMLGTISENKWCMLIFCWIILSFPLVWFCNGFGIKLRRKATRNSLWQKGAFLSKWVKWTKMFQRLLKVMNCYYDIRSRKHMNIWSVLTHRKIYSICSRSLIIFIVELKGRSFKWSELLNLFIRRIIWIGSHVVTFRI